MEGYVDNVKAFVEEDMTRLLVKLSRRVVFLD